MFHILHTASKHKLKWHMQKEDTFDKKINSLSANSIIPYW